MEKILRFPHEGSFLFLIYGISAFGAFDSIVF